MFYPLKFIDINLWSCTLMCMWSSVHLGAVYLCVWMHMLNSKLKEPPKKKFTVKLVNLGVKVFFSKKKKKKKKTKKKTELLSAKKTEVRLGKPTAIKEPGVIFWCKGGKLR